MDLFVVKKEVFLMFMSISSIRCNSLNVSLPYKIQISTLKQNDGESSHLNETRNTKMFVTKDKRQDYDFLYSDRDLKFVRKTPDSPRKQMDLKQILATFDEEDGGMVVELSKRKPFALHEPTLPEDLFDDLKCESVHSDEDDGESVEGRNENSEIVELSNETATPNIKGILPNNPVFQKKVHVKSESKYFAQKSEDTDAFKNALNIFDTKDGLVRGSMKPKFKLYNNEPTLPEIILDSDLHVSLIESNNEELRPQKVQSEGFNSEMTVDRTEEAYGNSKSVGHKLFDISSMLYGKKKLLTSPGTSEYDALKQEVNEEEKCKTFSTLNPRFHEKSMNMFETTASIDLDNLVNNFIAAQQNLGPYTHRAITHYLNVSSEEIFQKTKFRKRKGKTKFPGIKKKTEKETKRRGRPRKTTRDNVGSLKNTELQESNIRTKLANEQKSKCSEAKNHFTRAVNITNQLHYHNNTENYSKKTVTHEIQVKISKLENKFMTISREKIVLYTTNVFKEESIPMQSLKQTDDSKESSESDFIEDSDFTVVPILDSNFYNDLNEFSLTKRYIRKKMSTIPLKSFKNFDEKLKHLRELCTDYRQVRKKTQTNVTPLHLKYDEYKNISDLNLKESSNAEVEDIPIIDFANPWRIIQHKTRQKQYPWNFKIASWNVNGVRAWAKKDGFSFIKQHDLDVFCIQEVRCPHDKIPKCPSGYHSFWFPDTGCICCVVGTKQGYAGVAVLSRAKPITVTEGFPSNEEDDVDDGRVMTMEYEQFYLLNVYAPASKQDLSMLPKKLKWNSLLRDHVWKLNKIKPVVIAGDFNVAHQHLDVALALTHKDKSCFTPQERDDFSKLLSLGFVDAYRHLYPDIRIYSYWPYYDRPSKGNGWRLDYFLISSQMLSHLSDQEVHCDVPGSDHAPLILYLKL